MTPEESKVRFREKLRKEAEKLAEELGPEPTTLAEHARQEAILAARGRR